MSNRSSVRHVSRNHVGDNDTPVAGMVTRRGVICGILAGAIAGSADCAAAGGSRRVDVRAAGAKGDGKTDDSNAIAVAIAKAGRGDEVHFPPGTYLVQSEIAIAGRSGLEFTGDRATLVAADVRNLFDFRHCEGITFRELSFNAGWAHSPTYGPPREHVPQIPIRFADGRGLIIERCEFGQLYTAFVHFTAATDLKVRNCRFESTLQRQDRHLTFVEILSAGGAIAISDNQFLGAPTTRNDRSPSAVSASGITGSLAITDNHAEHCGRNNAGKHRLAVFDIYADAVNVVVARNIVRHCREQFMRLSCTVGAEISDNEVHVAPEADPTYSTMTIESGSFPFVRQPVTREVTVRRNRFIDPNRRQAFAIGILAYDWGAPNQQIRIIDNDIEGQRSAIVINGPFRDVSIMRNRVRHVDAFLVQELTGAVPLTRKLGVPDHAHYDDLEVEGNVVMLRAGSAAVPIALSTNAPRGFPGNIGRFEIRENRISGTTPRAKWAVSAIFDSSARGGELVAAENEITGYEVPFYLRSAKSVRLVGNLNHNDGPLYETDGTVESLELQ